MKIINKLLNKLPLILLCTIRIDEGLFDCRVLPQQGRDGATGSGPVGAEWHQQGPTPLVSVQFLIWRNLFDLEIRFFVLSFNFNLC